MATFPRGRKKRLILDVGTSAVRLCELVPTKTGYQLARYMQREYNADPALSEEDKKAARIKCLTELLKEGKIRRRKTISAVPGQSVFTRTRSLPPVPEYKVTQIVRYEIQQQIPFSLDQIAMDYQVLDRTAAGGYEVMMAAIKVDVVEKHVAVLEGAKLNVDTVDVAPLAAYNWLKHSGEFGEHGDCVALVDIGATTTDIVIERENQFRFTRPLNIGGNAVTLAIAKEFNMNFQDAERVKRQRGFAPTGDPERDGRGGRVIGEVLQRFVNEVVRSFAYFRSQPGGGQVNRVILSGGGACLRNIVPYLQQQLGVEVRIAQPLAGLAIAPGAQQVNDHPEQSAVALGLSLRCCEPVPLGINLIPPRILEVARRKEQVFYWALSLTTLALIMASIIPVRANENKAVRGEIETLKRFIGEYDPELRHRLDPDRPVPPSTAKKELNNARNRIASLKRDVEALDKARQERLFWIDHWALINENRPKAGGLWFSCVETSQIEAGGNQRGRRGGGRGGGRGGPDDTVESSGFPGIEAQRGGGGGGGFQRGRARRAPQKTKVPQPNGVVIHGFAESDETVKSYVENLRTAQRTMPNGMTVAVSKVHLNEATVKRVPWAILQQAPLCEESVRSNERAENFNPAYDSAIYSFTLHVEMQRGYNLAEQRGGNAQRNNAGP